MANAVVNSLPESEWLLIRETDRAALADLSEDELLELHDRIRRARNKYVKNYRRGASGRVAAAGGRGKAHAQNTRVRDRAEVFEDALARVSASLSSAARRSAADLKAERIATAQAAKPGTNPRPKAGGTKTSAPKPASRNTRRGDRSLVSPGSLKTGRQLAGSRGSAAGEARRPQLLTERHF